MPSITTTKVLTLGSSRIVQHLAVLAAQQSRLGARVLGGRAVVEVARDGVLATTPSTFATVGAMSTCLISIARSSFGVERRAACAAARDHQRRARLRHVERAVAAAHVALVARRRRVHDDVGRVGVVELGGEPLVGIRVGHALGWQEVADDARLGRRRSVSVTLWLAARDLGREARERARIATRVARRRAP